MQKTPACLRDIIFEINKKVRHPMAEVAVSIRIMQKGNFTGKELQQKYQKILKHLISADFALTNILHLPSYENLMEELPVIKALEA